MFSGLFARLSSTYFWYFSILGLVTPFLAVFLDGKGFTSLEIGEIIAIVTATRIIGPALWAVLADKTGQQLPIIRLGSLLACFSFSFLFISNSYWPITFCLALFTLFWSAILPQLEVMTLHSVRRSAKIYSRVRLWGSLGFIALAVIGGEVMSRFSSQVFTYLGLIILLALYGSTLLVKQPKIHLSQTVSKVSIFTKITDKSFLIFFLSGMLLQASFGPYYGFFALYLRDLTYPGYAVGLFISIGVVAEIGIFIYAGILFKYFSIKTLLIFSIFITGIRWYLIGQFADHGAILAISQLFHAASFGLYHGASIQFIQQHFDTNQQSRGQAIYIGGVFGLGGAIGAYVAGTLWLDGAGAQLAYNVAAVSALLGAFIALFLPKMSRS
ncbi:MAG: MFS transporter [Alteromonadaceae bacterium]|nr:MFS transporter [Alteromonadaceae bacterium]